MTSFVPLTHTPEPHCYQGRDASFPKEEQREVVEILKQAPTSTQTISYNEIQLPQNAQGKKAFIIDNLFTPEECEKLIQLSEAKGFEKALVNQHDHQQDEIPLIRNNYRTMMDDPQTASLIYERVKSFIPEMYGTHAPVGLNERMRYLRYDGEQKFDAHLDGTYKRPNSEERSLMTFQLYLNDNFEEGTGTTRFLEQNGIDGVDVKPRVGRVLVFEHDVLHSGTPPVNGRKYAIRTDIMFRPL
eukprot:TRINITY_DN44028_c0_g1_i1.p1 TRINITY_DN44028_c0_g1~~TRINITY_DN44028_c0_g1_i1.p1  ORF type:complete len:243 (+),score=36.78 TRINITY_DN44028_c0_g1_i1:28-756(+)